MKNRGAQITIFIIIAVVIIAGVVSYGLYTQNAVDSYFTSGEVSQGVSEIQEYMASCVGIASDDSLNLVTLHGGYYEKPQRYEDLGDGAFVTYAYYEGETHFPRIEHVTEELSRAVSAGAQDCVASADFAGFSLRTSSAETDVVISDTEVIFTVDMPVTIEREGHTMTLEMNEYPVTVPSKLKGMHAVGAYFVEDISDDFEYCVNCLAERALTHDILIDVISLDSTTSSVIMSDDSTLGEGNYTYFIFINKFKGDTPLELDYALGTPE